MTMEPHPASSRDEDEKSKECAVEPEEIATPPTLTLEAALVAPMPSATLELNESPMSQTKDQAVQADGAFNRLTVLALTAAGTRLGLSRDLLVNDLSPELLPREDVHLMEHLHDIHDISDIEPHGVANVAADRHGKPYRPQQWSDAGLWDVAHSQMTYLRDHLKRKRDAHAQYAQSVYRSWHRLQQWQSAIGVLSVLMTVSAALPARRTKQWWRLCLGLCIGVVGWIFKQTSPQGKQFAGLITEHQAAVGALQRLRGDCNEMYQSLMRKDVTEEQHNKRIGQVVGMSRELDVKRPFLPAMSPWSWWFMR